MGLCLLQVAAPTSLSAVVLAVMYTPQLRTFVRAGK
jgi:hypothetical protein